MSLDRTLTVIKQLPQLKGAFALSTSALFFSAPDHASLPPASPTHAFPLFPHRAQRASPPVLALAGNPLCLRRSYRDRITSTLSKLTARVLQCWDPFSCFRFRSSSVSFFVD